MEINKDNIFQEILEFAVSVVWLGIAFGIAIAGGTGAFSNLKGLGAIIIQSLIVVFFAFVFHELAHRIAARRYGFKAVYHVWIPGLILAMGAALFGFLFAAPGGVYIQVGQNTAENRAKLGKSALAGPVVNIVLTVLFAVIAFAFVFFVRSYLTSTGNSEAQLAQWVNTFFGILLIGVQINAWLAFFNLIPFGAFDGYKVFQWNKKVWIVTFIISIALYLLVLWAQSALL
jgi:Zn-dependent protease